MFFAGMAARIRSAPESIKVLCIASCAATAFPMFKQTKKNKKNKVSGVAQQEGTNPHVRKGIPNPYLCSVQGALGSFGLCLARLNVTLCSPSGEESRFWVFGCTFPQIQRLT